MRTNKSTDEIHQMITLLQKDSKSAVDSVKQSKEKAEIGMISAQRTSDALNEIVQNIQQLSDLNTQVATATEEQSVVVSEINVHTISDSTENSATTAAGMASSSESLSEMAKNLDNLVAQFKI